MLSFKPSSTPLDDTLTASEIEALVVTHADFFERELRPLLTTTQDEALSSAILKPAGFAYAGDGRLAAPARPATVEMLSQIHVAMANGVEKNQLGQIIQDLRGVKLAAAPSDTQPFRQ